MPLGKALGATFSLPQDQGGQMAPASTARAEQPMFPEMKGADQGILEAAPGTAESESYIESIMDLENWLIDAYSQGIRPDKPNLRDPGAIAANKLYRSKVANIKRQAAQLASMKKLNDQVQANIMKGDFYAMGPTATDPMSGMPMAPTTEDYGRLVSTDIAPMVKAFQGTSPKGNVYDTVGLIDATDRFNKTIEATNVYYDDLAAKFPNPQYQQNIEAARQQSMDVLNTLRPMGKVPTSKGKGKGPSQADIDKRMEKLAKIRIGDEEIMKEQVGQKLLGRTIADIKFVDKGSALQDDFGNPIEGSPEYAQEDMIVYSQRTAEGDIVPIAAIASADIATQNDLFNTEEKNIPIDVIRDRKPFEVAPRVSQAFTEEDENNVQRLFQGDQTMLSKLKAPGVTSIRVVEVPWYQAGSDHIEVVSNGVTEKIVIGEPGSEERIKELYVQAKGGGGAGKWDKHKR